MRENIPPAQKHMELFFLKKKDGLSGTDRFLKFVMLVVISFVLVSAVPTKSEDLGRSLEPGRMYRLTVAANEAWTDTGYDVRRGQEVQFRTTGGVSLQMGNPMAYCGPDGYDLRTLQQPLPDNNIGALIGKVVLLISIEIDEETGEETRNEIVRFFYIGSNQRISVPLDGRLFLGPNENVVEDNSGQYTVEFRLTQTPAE
ncbi:MAG: hypothetical protein JXB23_09315 [Candidatus Aminicenantes bacterium]|nr:hypothetical protein [Candidatus Aminicenantes bacterium]